MAGFTSGSNHLALLIVELLPEAHAHRVQENLRRGFRGDGPEMVRILDELCFMVIIMVVSW